MEQWDFCCKLQQFSTEQFNYSITVCEMIWPLPWFPDISEKSIEICAVLLSLRTRNNFAHSSKMPNSISKELRITVFKDKIKGLSHCKQTPKGPDGHHLKESDITGFWSSDIWYLRDIDICYECVKFYHKGQYCDAIPNWFSFLSSFQNDSVKYKPAGYSDRPGRKENKVHQYTFSKQLLYVWHLEEKGRRKQR